MRISLSALSILTVLGPLFLLAGAWRCFRAGAWVAQGRTWLIVGTLFSAVAGYLAWSQASGS